RIWVPVSGTSTPAPGRRGSRYSRLSSNSGWGFSALMWLLRPSRWRWKLGAFFVENGASYTWIRDRHGVPSGLIRAVGWASIGRIRPRPACCLLLFSLCEDYHLDTRRTV